jgi:fucose 4-O-acetylase-like acetyltransferase
VAPLLAYSNIVTPDFVIFYLLGIACRLSNDTLLVNPAFTISAIILTISLGAVSTDSSYLIRIPFVVAVMFFIVWLGQLPNLPKALGVFSKLGRNSMSILCWHAFIIASLRPFGSLFLKIDSTGITYAVIATLIGVLGSLYLTLLSDKLGVSNILFGMHRAYKKTGK